MAVPKKKTSKSKSKMRSSHLRKKLSTIKYVEDKTDMENIEVRSKCIDDPEIADLKIKTGRSLWNEFKKGHLTLDLNYVNE